MAILNHVSDNLEPGAHNPYVECSSHSTATNSLETNHSAVLANGSPSVRQLPGAQQPLRFDGPAYVPSRDRVRLTSQIGKIFELMKDGKWRTFAEIHKATGAPEASISANLRHLRKARFGGHSVERRHVVDGLHQYRLIERQK